MAGVTSNPAIFDKAISGSEDYDTQLQSLVREGVEEEFSSTGRLGCPGIPRLRLLTSIAEAPKSTQSRYKETKR
jgi:Transaldolase/Fructose-6-phosphate aldolase